MVDSFVLGVDAVEKQSHVGVKDGRRTCGGWRVGIITLYTRVCSSRKLKLVSWLGGAAIKKCWDAIMKMVLAGVCCVAFPE